MSVYERAGEKEQELSAPLSIQIDKASFFLKKQKNSLCQFELTKRPVIYWYIHTSIVIYVYVCMCIYEFTSVFIFMYICICVYIYTYHTLHVCLALRLICTQASNERMTECRRR